MGNSNGNGLQTEYEFELPKGIVDKEGTLQRKGRMRMATALDEIQPLRDPRVKSNQAYLSIVILSRVVTELGGMKPVETDTLENLFTADLVYLQDMYRRINGDGDGQQIVTCPNCEHHFAIAQDGAPGES